MSKRDIFNIPRKMTINRRFIAAGLATLIGSAAGFSLAMSAAEGTAAQAFAARLPACNSPEIIERTAQGVGPAAVAVGDFREDDRVRDGHDLAAFCRATAIMEDGTRQAFAFHIGWHTVPGGEVYLVGDLPTR
jgi:hypothetical protein